MSAYYNEIDPRGAAWLRELIRAGCIAPGEVDERSIEDVLPSDVRNFVQCHWFAGIAVWSYALRSSGWADDRHVWTGSCPCQPFSAAGKRVGFADERNLWPAFHHLIKECRPSVVFGEQVASSSIDPWVDLVHADLEALGYAFGAVPFPSASVGAPHIRDRIYWVADSSGARLDQRQRVAGIPGRKIGADARQTAVGNGVCSVVGMADSDDDGPLDGVNSTPRRPAKAASEHCCAVGVGNSAIQSRERIAGSVLGAQAPVDSQGVVDGSLNLGSEHAGSGMGERPGPTNGFWRSADWLGCRDGKWRPVEPGLKPLVNGAAARVVRGGSDGLPIDSDKTGEARVMRLRGYGNSINAVQAQAFIEAFMGYQQQV